ncbi:MAG: AAA-like domain-containing protein [Bacteroidales bacterium]|jgi:AAA+ ATPase superfamily predicted ATPase|nr:AAA-like domain-containing protein [Bacteroidales bacterium]
MNPFLTRGYVSAQYFCDRENETETLVRKTTNGNSIVLMSPRRMGKTGLIHHCFAQKEISNNYYTFFIDIYATTNLQEFVFKLGKDIFDKLKPRGRKFLEKFFAVISAFRPAFKIDAITGEPGFDMSMGLIEKPLYVLEDIFKYLQESDKPCIVAIDEFQQIAKYPEKNIEAQLRTLVQKTTNAVFVFAGSQRSIMQNIFFSSSQPFYQSVFPINLDEIEKGKYAEFVQKHFRKAKKKISNEQIFSVYDLFEGHTWYLQSVFNELYSLVKDNEGCNKKALENAVKNAIFSNEKLYKNMLLFLSQRQRELLYAIAKEGKALNITSGDFVRKHALLSSSSVQNSANTMLDKEIITNENGSYQVYDKFFGLWLATEYGVGYTIPTIK